MSKKSVSKIAVDKPVRERDIASGKLVLRQRAKSGEILPRGGSSKQRVNIFLDSVVVEHFKAKAGGRGYQTLINEALKQSMQSESIERMIRYTIQQEMKAYKV
jgi:uncharacterized protein (DUF4415 family)